MSDKLDMEKQDSEFSTWVGRYSENNCIEDENMDGENKDIKFARYFLVDYENVNRDGLNGIMKLTKDDCVRIYYSPSAETMTFGLHRRIIASKAYFEYIKVQIPIKNAVDCQILFDIRDMIKENRNAEYFIVSKDTDFDKAIEEFSSHNIKVMKVLEVCKRNEPIKKNTIQKKDTKQTEKSDEEKREAQVRSFFGQNFKEKVYDEHKEEIIQIVLTKNTKQQINNNLMKIYGSEIVREIYKKLKPIIKDLPGR